VSGNDDGAGEQLAQWLKDAGRRAGLVAPLAAAADSDEIYNSPASLHRYLEELAGKPLRSHAEVLNYLAEVAGSRPLTHEMSERRRMVRELALIGLLAMSYLHYYFWDVQLQIAALNSARVFIPASPPPEKKA
jgi:hypothetical protein